MNKGNAILKPDTKELDALSELHKALGDYTRIRILWLLMEREWCVSELAGEMKMTESAISHQLRILRSARLVNGHKVGKNVFYSLADEHVREILENTYDHISEQ
ncbi:MAG: metalloregulator ArsR/SmtB family transcription factor [Oscillospiraceae bacterium]|nr:metalloregulator ArsR/SmtB family transcription factor [Oscillospiraceae bacterium]